MTQKISPFLEGKYGWDFGENGWNTGADENWLKFSYLFDGNVDGIVATLPAVQNGKAYFLTADNRLYFAIGTTWYSSPTPKWFNFTIRATGQSYQFNGSTTTPIKSNQDIDTRLMAVELQVSGLGTAATKNSEFFASSTQLASLQSSSTAYTDTLRSDLSASTGTAGASRVGFDGTNLATYIKSSTSKVIQNISLLRALDKTKVSQVFVLGYYTPGDGGGGSYFYDSTDSSSVDNAGTIIVATDNGRWKFVGQEFTVKTFGAKVDGSTDDTLAVKNCMTYCGSTHTVKFTDGICRITSPLSIKTEMHIKGVSHDSILLMDGAFECFVIDSTLGSVMGGSIMDIRLASTVNTLGSCGIRVIGAATSFVAKWIFSRVRFSGFYAGVKVEKGHSNSGGWLVSLFTVNMFSACIWDEWNNNESQYGILADGVNTLTVCGGICRAVVSGIALGDGNIGLGDILVTGVHFNYGSRTISIVGSNTAGVYKHNISITGNQFDGLNTLCIYARSLELFKVNSNNYGGSVPNDIQDCPRAEITRDTFQSNFGYHKVGIAAGASVPLFKVSTGTLPSGNYHSCYVEVSVHALVAGLGQATTTQAYNLLWNAGTLSLSAAKFNYTDQAGGSVITMSVTNTANEAVFNLAQNSSSAGTDVSYNIRIIGDVYKLTPL